MAINADRKYTKEFVMTLLDGVIGKTLGEVDFSGQFMRTKKSEKITGIAGDVIEQSVFRYNRDSKQECDIEIDGIQTELKTTGVRVPKKDLKIAESKTGADYNILLGAKEGISITRMTLEPTYQRDFYTSHFWEKAKNLLIVFYDYKAYEVVPASHYATFPIVGYCFNQFTANDQSMLRSDWEIVRDFIAPYYTLYPLPEERREAMVGFTHKLRSQLLLVDLVPSYKRLKGGSYQTPRYRLKQTFVDYLVRRHFRNEHERKEETLAKSFSSFAELDKRCKELTHKYKGKTFTELKEIFEIETSIESKNFSSLCIIRMFGGSGNKLSEITDFSKAGIIPKTITLYPNGAHSEDMKLRRIDFDEWSDRDTNFEESEIYEYFSEHSLLCPIFCEHDSLHQNLTTFEGFKRFAFDDEFLYSTVKKTWEDSRHLIHTNTLEWEYQFDKDGNPLKNKSGSYRGAPNFPKSADYTIFFRGGSNDSSDKHRTEVVNNIKMLPQYYWLKGSYVAGKLKTLPYI
ncbi:MAG: hypothetical protein K2M62_07425 [Muribaculaceae bacterium]|nr:hypothetical protein [Muribaculaceae bacterium]